jgi:hypothetical protein
VAVAVVGLFTSYRIAWDGGWPPEEYSFTFRDRDGHPVPGVELRVESEAGADFYFFPVADYLPDHIPTSDARGVLVFHHAPSSDLSGGTLFLFGVIPVETASPPHYVCRFLLGGGEVHRVRYSELTNVSEVRVKRRWRWLTPEEVLDQVYRGDERWGRPPEHMSREERYFARSASEALTRAEDIKYFGKPASEELEFVLVERTVTVDRPKPP